MQENVTWNENDGVSEVPLSSPKENKSSSKSDSDYTMTRLRRKLTLLIYSSAKEALHNDRK